MTPAIPAQYNDGFTWILDGKLVRQMTWEARQNWLAVAQNDSKLALRMATSPPFVLNKKIVDSQEEVAVVKFVAGYSPEDEQDDLFSLAESITLQVKNPGLSVLSCLDCSQFCVDHDKGEIQKYPDGSPKLLPIGIPLPCETTAGCGKGHWKNPAGLSDPRWKETWQHYWLYKGDPPAALRRDPIFLRNKALLTWIIDYGRRTGFNPFVG